MSLLEATLSGERLALSRLLTEVENDTPAGKQALDELYPYTGHAHLIGVTGAPGSGKSTLVNQLVRQFRQPQGDEMPSQVAVVAVDPSSPFSGGAVLGDRVRMRDVAGDEGVFIRSMAARGAAGGLARSTDAIVQVLDAAGFARILIETVGAGQSEVDVARLAHTVVVVEAPGTGDDIQAIKAGILEIADILVINKADRPEVENTEYVLRAMLQRAGNHKQQTLLPEDRPQRSKETPSAPWEIPVLRTVAAEGQGVSALAQTILEHAAYLKRHSLWQQREMERIRRRLDELACSELISRWRSTLPQERYQSVVEKLAQRQLSPSAAVGELLATPTIETD